MASLLGDADPETQDPKPGEKPNVKRAPGNRRAAQGPKRPPTEKQIATQCAMYLMLGGGMWQMRGDQCGAILAEQAQEIGAAMAALIVDSPALAKLFEHSDLMLKIAALGSALAPVGKAIYAHHVAGGKTEEDPEEVMFRDATFPAYRPATSSASARPVG